MAKKTAAEPTKQRTRQHVIASQSLNHVEKFVYDEGYSAERVQNDYGYDLLVSTYDALGYVESGFILIQLKATDHIKVIKKNTLISFSVSIKDYRLWIASGFPVFLIVYDAMTRTAYWLYFQKYFGDEETRKPNSNTTTVTVRIPVGDVLSETTMAYMRESMTRCTAELARVRHHD